MYFRSTPVLRVCSRYAARYGDVIEQFPGQNEKPPLSHWKRSISAEGLLRRRPHLRRRHPGQRERLAEIRGQHQRARLRGPLLRAAVRILDEIPRALAQADQRGRRELEVEAAEARHHAGGNASAFHSPTAFVVSP